MRQGHIIKGLYRRSPFLKESVMTTTLRARHETRCKGRVKNKSQISSKNRPETEIEFNGKAIKARGPAISHALQGGRTTLSLTQKALKDNILSRRHLRSCFLLRDNQPWAAGSKGQAWKDKHKKGSKEPTQTITIRNKKAVVGPQRRDVAVNRLLFDETEKESGAGLTLLNPLNARADLETMSSVRPNQELWVERDLE